MSKLYVFGIGGTGARVIKSLTMLLASGVKCEADIVVPILIDPDSNSGNLTQTVSLLQQYCSIRKKIEPNDGDNTLFFSTKIAESVQDFKLPLKNISNKKFSEYIAYDTMTKSNKSLMSMLFSDDNMAANMQVGFKGNPNIGSVVLNQFVDSEEFINFANDFKEGDKIFIISSIFGGTGASGFPLLLKTLRTNSDIPNHALINGAMIGAITVMPYFNLEQDNNSKIDSDTFISKTKAALAYYERNISDNNEVDYLYYIGDTISNSYKNCEGGIEQLNGAHIVELISSLAILDFVKQDKSKVTKHKEFGVNDVSDKEKVIFQTFCSTTKVLLEKPLTQFLLFTKFMQEHLIDSHKQVWYIDEKNKFNATFWSSDFMKLVKTIQQSYVDWLSEMENNTRSFAPYNLERNDSNLFGLVNGVSPTGMGAKYWNKSNYDLFDTLLNEQTKKSNNRNTTQEKHFIDLFYQVTDRLTSEKLNFK